VCGGASEIDIVAWKKFWNSDFRGWCMCVCVCVCRACVECAWMVRWWRDVCGGDVGDTSASVRREVGQMCDCPPEVRRRQDLEIGNIIFSTEINRRTKIFNTTTKNHLGAQWCASASMFLLFFRYYFRPLFRPTCELLALYLFHHHIAVTTTTPHHTANERRRWICGVPERTAVRVTPFFWVGKPNVFVNSVLNRSHQGQSNQNNSPIPKEQFEFSSLKVRKYSGLFSRVLKDEFFSFSRRSGNGYRGVTKKKSFFGTSKITFSRTF